ELSISELNKMSTLWDGKQPVGPEILSALKSDYLEKKNASECVSHVRLTGKKNERGLLWVIPTLIQKKVILNKITKSDEYGQVTEVTEEIISFPFPKSIRSLGLKSE